MTALPQELRDHLTALLTQPQAHLTLAQVAEDFPAEHINARPAGSPHTPWQLLWHLRFTQRDLLDYMAAEHYTPRQWPADYWPSDSWPGGAGSPAQWRAELSTYADDLAALVRVVQTTPDLLAPVPHAQEPGHTFLRSALLAADHAAYHTGQLALLRRALDRQPAT